MLLTKKNWIWFISFQMNSLIFFLNPYEFFFYFRVHLGIFENYSSIKSHEVSDMFFYS